MVLPSPSPTPSDTSLTSNLTPDPLPTPSHLSSITGILYGNILNKNNEKIKKKKKLHL